jgi:hypothetical protein
LAKNLSFATAELFRRAVDGEIGGVNNVGGANAFISGATGNSGAAVRSLILDLDALLLGGAALRLRRP